MEISKQTPQGGVIISEEAVSSIVTNAAKDVNGVTGFSNKPDDVVSTIKKGSLKVMSPVRVFQDGDDLDISVYINIASGIKIQPVAEEVQLDAVRARLDVCGDGEVDSERPVAAGGCARHLVAVEVQLQLLAGEGGARAGQAAADGDRVVVEREGGVQGAGGGAGQQRDGGQEEGGEGGHQCAACRSWAHRSSVCGRRGTYVPRQGH